MNKNTDEEIEKHMAISKRKFNNLSLTAFIISIVLLTVFFVCMPFLGTYFLRPSGNYMYVILIVVLCVILVATIIGLILGILGIKQRRNPLGLASIVINSVVLLANLGMIIFLIYIQITRY
ncbi:MAG: hypothetical protein ACTSO7_04290 [Candidatus Heimdallarchaeota archaeon]